MKARRAASSVLRLYYYTGKHWGIKALWEKRLKLARLADFNSPFEVMPFKLEKPASRRFWHERVAQIADESPGFVCLSEDWQSTVMWSHYGEKHTGICLGFDVPRSEAIEVRYVAEPVDAPKASRRASEGSAKQALLDAMRFKDRVWRYEKEWRLPAPLQRSVDGIFYKRFDDTLHLREVILGARCSMTPADVVDAVVNPPLDVEVFQARAAHGKFEICRHELVDTHNRKGFRAALALAKDVYLDELPNEE